MNDRCFQHRGGAVAIGMMLMAVVILGALLTLNTAAVISMGKSSRALDTARQDTLLASRIERATAMAAQQVFGASASPMGEPLLNIIRAELDSEDLGESEITAVEMCGIPVAPCVFPQNVQPNSGWGAPSKGLLQFATPQLRRCLGERVVESTPFTVRCTFRRKSSGRIQTHAVDVDCRLVSVPLTRFALVPYDLPQEVGASAGRLKLPADLPAGALPPMGLVPGRDPAGISFPAGTADHLGTGTVLRPWHFRYAAALLNAYQYVFSSEYLRRIADYAGPTHFVRIGLDADNPEIDGAEGRGDVYQLDVAQLGHGRLGALEANKGVLVISATGSGQHARLVDTGGESAPALILLLGPPNPAAGPLTVELGSDVIRPLVMICCNVELSPAGSTQFNGALLLDPACSISGGGSTLAVGHISYWAGGTVDPSRFRLASMPVSASEIAPQVVYAATRRTLH